LLKNVLIGSKVCQCLSLLQSLASVAAAQTPQTGIVAKMSRFPSDTKVFVGELGNNASQTELEDAFSHYGPLKNVWLARNPPGFAFVEFEDPRDAKDSVRGLDGTRVCGHRVVVEMSNGKKRNRQGGDGRRDERGGGGSGMSPRGGAPPPRRPRFDANDKCYECGERGHYAYNCHRRRGGRR